MAKQPGFFDMDERMRRLSDLGDQLEAYASAVDFEVFRPDLENALSYSDGARGGRPPFDPVVRPPLSDRWRSGPHCSRSS